MHRYHTTEGNGLKIGILAVALAIIVGYLIDDLTGTPATLPGIVTGKFITRAAYGRYRVVDDGAGEDDERRSCYYLEFDIDGMNTSTDVEYSTWRNARAGTTMMVHGNFGRITRKFYAHDAW